MGDVEHHRTRCRGYAAMRAETEKTVDAIKESISLLRRHL